MRGHEILQGAADRRARRDHGAAGRAEVAASGDPLTFRSRLALTTLIQGLALVLSAVFVLLAARWLGPSGKGLQAVLVSAGQVLALVLSFGVGASMPFVVSSDVRRAPLVARRQAWLLIVAGVILVAGSVANRVALVLPGLVGVEVVLITFTLLSIAQQSYATLALSAGRILTFNLSALVGVVFSLGALGVFVLTDLITAESVVASQAIGMGVATTYVLGDLWRQRLLSPQFAAGAAWINQVPAAISGYALALLTLLMLRVDIFLVTAIAGLRAGGIYSVTVAFAELLLRLPHWASFLLMPIAAEQRLGARTQTVRLFWLSLSFSLATFFVALLLGGVIEPLIVAVLGAEFAPVLIALYATFPRIIFQAGTTILIGNMAGWGYTAYPPTATAVGLVIVIVADILLIPELGLVGAGLAAGAAALGTLLLVVTGFLRLNGMSVALFMPTAAWRKPIPEEQTSAV